MHADAERTPVARAARVAAAVVALDAAAKALAVTHLAEREVAIAGPLSLALAYNDTFGRGLDLGALTAPANFALTLAFVLLAAVVCTALARIDDRAPRALGLVAGAAIANAADFAYTGRGAVDFLAVATPDGAIIFNLADVAAYAGVLLLAGTTVALCRAIVAEREVALVALPRAADRRLHAMRATVTQHRAPRAAPDEVVRPVPLYAEPIAGGRANAGSPSAPLYPPVYPAVHLPADDIVVDVPPPLGFER